MKFRPLKLIPFISIPVLLISFQNCSKVGTNGISVDQIQSGQSTDLLPQVSDTPMDPGVTTPPENQDPSNTDTSNTGTSNTNISNSNTTPSNTNTSSTNTISNTTTTTNTNTSAQDDHDKDDDKDCHDDKDKTPSSDKKQSGDNDKKKEDEDDHKQSNTEPAIADAIKACNDPKPLSQPSENLILQFNHESIELDANSVSSIKGNWGQYVIIRAATKENAQVGSIQVNHTTLILCNFSEIKEIKGTHNRIIVVDGKIQEIHAYNSNISLVNASVEKSKGANSIIKSYNIK